MIIVNHHHQDSHLKPDACGVLVIVEDFMHRGILLLKRSHQALMIAMVVKVIDMTSVIDMSRRTLSVNTAMIMMMSVMMKKIK